MTSADLGGPALRTFFKLAARWRLSEEEQMKLLGLENHADLEAWRSGHTDMVGRDSIERISYLLGIFKAINILLPVPRRADEWIRRPNKAAVFGGRSPLDRMCAGNVGDLYVVRQYLDAQLV